MSKDKNTYISSISPTIGVKEQRELLKITKDLSSMLTRTEFIKVMTVYEGVINRLFEENGIKES